MSTTRQETITQIGNPAKPQGREGQIMLERMNIEHYELTGWALEYFVYNESDQILDIGCGGGRTLNRMAEHIGSGHLTGIDYSEVSVNLSRLTNQEYITDGRMDIVQASVEKMPFDDNSFDKIITVESFYFWPNPGENLKEVYRVLKPAGKLLLVSEIHDCDELTDKQRENIKKYNLYNPSLETFDGLMKNAGFDKVQVHTKEDTCWVCVEGEK